MTPVKKRRGYKNIILAYQLEEWKIAISKTGGIWFFPQKMPPHNKIILNFHLIIKNFSQSE